MEDRPEELKQITGDDGTTDVAKVRDAILLKNEGIIEPKDLKYASMAVEKMVNPDMPMTKIFDKHYPDKVDRVKRQNKHAKVKTIVNRITNKYPEVFKPFRDSSIINFEDLIKDTLHIAKTEKKVADRLKATKLLFDTAVQAEKIAKERKSETLSMEDLVFEGKSFNDIITETRTRHKV